MLEQRGDPPCGHGHAKQVAPREFASGGEQQRPPLGVADPFRRQFDAKVVREIGGSVDTAKRGQLGPGSGAPYVA